MWFAAFLARNPEETKTKQSRKNIINAGKHCLAINKHLRGFICYYFLFFLRNSSLLKRALNNVIRSADNASARLDLNIVWLILFCIRIIDVYQE